MVTDIAALTAEIDEINRANGWRETTPTFSEAMMLLVSEAAEALDAWRKWDLKDMTLPPVTLVGSTYAERQEVPSKPEGVGSEFADIAIRLLDDCAIFGLPLRVSLIGLDPDSMYGRLSEGGHKITLQDPPGSFPEAMFQLTKTAVGASDAWDAGHQGPVANHLTAIWLMLRYFALMYSVDLDKEIRRKLDYNRTRGYRHGGKRLQVTGQSCPCTSPATVTVEWECGQGHKGYAALCKDHGAIHVAALLSGDIRCGQCRREGGERATVLRRVNGKLTGAFRTIAG